MSPASRLRSLRNAASVAASALPELAAADFREGVLAAARRGWRLCALFARPGKEGLAGRAGLRAVLADDEGGSLYALDSVPLEAYPALTPELPAAHLFERELREAAGVEPQGHPWPKPVRALPDGGDFFAVKGAEVHEVAVGPVHAGIIEPGHFRFQCHGETVHHLEIALGYQHRGVEALLAGGPDRRSVFVAESIAGDAAVAHGLAYCLAVEALAGGEVPLRGAALRAAALELERLSNHAGDLGALANDVGFLPAAAWFGRLRGEFLNLLMELSGSRYGRGLARPGGAAFDLTAELARDFSARLAAARADLASLGELLFGDSSVIARFEETGVVSRQAARDLGLVGPAARASGLDRDVRQDHPEGLYRFRHIPVMKVDSGDVYGRALVRWLEAQRSLEFLEALVPNLPGGPARLPCPPPAPGRFAVALVEGWRGEVCHAAETGPDGRLRGYKVVDPSFHDWAGLALAMRGGEVSDFPLCNKSFNLSYAGHDL